jgi:hypothetical protein
MMQTGVFDSDQIVKRQAAAAAGVAPDRLSVEPAASAERVGRDDRAIGEAAEQRQLLLEVIRHPHVVAVEQGDEPSGVRRRVRRFSRSRPPCGLTMTMTRGSPAAMSWTTSIVRSVDSSSTTISSKSAGLGQRRLDRLGDEAGRAYAGVMMETSGEPGCLLH